MDTASQVRGFAVTVISEEMKFSQFATTLRENDITALSRQGNNLPLKKIRIAAKLKIVSQNIPVLSVLMDRVCRKYFLAFLLINVQNNNPS